MTVISTVDDVERILNLFNLGVGQLLVSGTYVSCLCHQVDCNTASYI